MDRPRFQLEGITIAPVAVKEMVTFYNGVFEAGLTGFPAAGTTFYRGELAGLRLLFCPNELLQIEAEKNRQQLSFMVDDIEAVVKTAVFHGGTILQEISTMPAGKAAGITDTDGNSIELKQLLGDRRFVFHSLFSI